MVEIGTADRLRIRGASDEPLAKIVAGVDTREEAQILFFHGGAAIEQDALPSGEAAGGLDQLDDVVHADRVALGIAPVVARGVLERARGVDIGLLNAHATGEAQAVLQQRQVAADEGG